MKIFRGGNSGEISHKTQSVSDALFSPGIYFSSKQSSAEMYAGRASLTGAAAIISAELDSSAKFVDLSDFVSDEFIIALCSDHALTSDDLLMLTKAKDNGAWSLGGKKSNKNKFAQQDPPAPLKYMNLWSRLLSIQGDSNPSPGIQGAWIRAMSKLSVHAARVKGAEKDEYIYVVYDLSALKNIVVTPMPTINTDKPSSNLRRLAR